LSPPAVSHAKLRWVASSTPSSFCTASRSRRREPLTPISSRRDARSVASGAGAAATLAARATIKKGRTMRVILESGGVAHERQFPWQFVVVVAVGHAGAVEALEQHGQPVVVDLEALVVTRAD